MGVGHDYFWTGCVEGAAISNLRLEGLDDMKIYLLSLYYHPPGLILPCLPAERGRIIQEGGWYM
jgi:hypothetical protein